MTNDTQGQVDTAYHEAGHAVMGRVLGLTCGRASIVPNQRQRTAGYSMANVERSIEDWNARGRLKRQVYMYRARIMMLQARREAEIASKLRP